MIISFGNLLVKKQSRGAIGKATMSSKGATKKLDSQKTVSIGSRTQSSNLVSKEKGSGKGMLLIWFDFMIR